MTTACVLVFRPWNEVIINWPRFYSGMRANYVDILAGSTKKTSISGAANLFDVLPKSQSVPANMFIPPGKSTIMFSLLLYKIIVCSYYSIVNIFIICFVVSGSQGATRQPAGNDGAAGGGQQPPQQQVCKIIRSLPCEY